jgi:hypothetical protein
VYNNISTLSIRLVLVVYSHHFFIFFSFLTPLLPILKIIESNLGVGGDDKAVSYEGSPIILVH